MATTSTKERRRRQRAAESIPPLKLGLPRMTKIGVARVRPVQLAFQGIGPFRGTRPAIVNFVGAHTDNPSYATPDSLPGKSEWRPLDDYSRSRPHPRIFLLLGAGAADAPTMLGSIYGLFDLLSSRPSGPLALGDGEWVTPDATVQLDLLVDLILDGTPREVMLTLWYGSRQPPVDWAPLVLDGKAWAAKEWARIGFFPIGNAHDEIVDELGAKLLTAFRAAEGTETGPRVGFGPIRHSVAGCPLPMAGACLFEPRRPGHFPGYRPAHRFTTDLGIMLSDLRESGWHPSSREGFDAIVRREIRLLTGREPDHPYWEWYGGEAAHPGSTGLEEFERTALTVALVTSLRATRDTILLAHGLDLSVGPHERDAFGETLVRLVRSRPGATLVASVQSLAVAKAIYLSAERAGLAVGGTFAIGVLKR